MRKVVPTTTLAVFIAGSGLAMTGCGGLSATSTCKDYAKASAGDQRAVVQKVLGDHGMAAGAFSIDLGRAAYDVWCTGHAAMTLQDGYLQLEAKFAGR